MRDVVYGAGAIAILVVLGIVYYRFFDIVIDPRRRSRWARPRDLMVPAGIAGLAFLAGLALLALLR